MREQEIREAVYRALDEVNELLPSDEQLTKSPETLLAGEQGGLDSMSVVNLVLATEDAVEAAFGVRVDLADQDAYPEDAYPLASVSALCGYLDKLLAAGDS